MGILRRFLSRSPINTENNQSEIIVMGVVDEMSKPAVCPICNKGPQIATHPNGGIKEVKSLEGPFFRYNRRESEFYFDLKKKYLNCSNCGEEIVIVDYQVMVELLASKLPPEVAKRFTMKNMNLLELYPDKMKEIIMLLFREFEEGTEFLALEDDEAE
jgi:hypothetical protein